MRLTASVDTISGVGTSYCAKLEKLGVATIFDLLYHLPFRYEDRSQTSTIAQIQAGETVSVSGTIVSIKNEITKSRKFIQKATISDQSGSIEVVWFNQPFLVKALKGKSVSLYSKVDFFGRVKTLVSPDYELLATSHKLIHTGRIVPVYPETAGITSKWLRSKIFSLLQTLPETDPWPAPPNFPSWKISLQQVHFPTYNLQPTTDNCHQRLAFDELLLLQLSSIIRRQNWLRTVLASPLSVSQESVLEFINRLPFVLTVSQNRVIKEILSDLSQTRPMNRLLEGEVGSGKTVVAAIAAYVAHQNGFQSVILAPTQILAQQHFATLSTLFKPFGINISLITSQFKSHISHLKSHILIGTHALLSTQNQKLFTKVGLVIIDEQHRFGVLQRQLAANLGKSPHILTMTATPIPRSVALTMYGDLDLSVITEKPPGRLPVKTWLVPESKRTSAYKWISDQLQAISHKPQAIFVCPFIEDSETMTSVKAAKSEYDKLLTIFPHFSLGLLHGRLSVNQKNQVISDFRLGKTSILVTTPIIEVGLDIPNAHIMVIEEADRFGLAQLHQLRGRVGRSDIQSYCLLFTSKTDSIPRLQTLEKLSSGIELAEADLKFRGPGEIYGTVQHGFPQFKIAGYHDLTLIQTAKDFAQQLITQLHNYPILQDLLKEDKISLTQPN